MAAGTIFAEIGLALILATAGALIARVFKQPLIPAYILSGVLIGPILGLVSNPELIATISEIGVLFLLFIVGLEFELGKLRNVGSVSLIGGTLQILVLFLSGFGIGLLLGYETIQAMYLGLMISFSSTMVVIKLLSDKKEMDTLHGNMVLARLLIEDVFAILAITVLAIVGSSTIVKSNWLTFFVDFVAITVLIVAGYFLLPRLFKAIARTGELLFITAVSVCFLFALTFHYFNMSASIGAFLAGVLLGNLPYNIEIIGRVKPLRDFFAVLFFSSLGMQLGLDITGTMLLALGIFALFIALIKPVFFIVVSALFGYRKHPIFYAGIALAQTSEFGLIIVAQGVALGAIPTSILSLAILLAIITITTSSYYLKFDDRLYRFFTKPLNKLDRFAKEEAHEFIPEGSHPDIVLVGYNRVGYGIFKQLHKSKKSFFVVDFNPEVIRDLVQKKIPCLYGDAGDLEILERLDFKKKKMVISTVYNEQTNKLLIQKAREENPRIQIFVTAYRVEEALSLYDKGADYVILPHFLGGDHVSLMLEEITTDMDKLLKKKISHIEELYTHHKRGHKPPSSPHHKHYHQQHPHKPHHKH